MTENLRTEKRNKHTKDKFSCISTAVKTNIKLKWQRRILPYFKLRILTKTLKPIQMFLFGVDYSHRDYFIVSECVRFFFTASE